MKSRRESSVQFDTSTPSNFCQCPEWIIEAWDELVHRSPVRAEEIAELMGVHVSTLYNFATKPTNAGGHHHCPRMFYIVPATKASGNPVLINALAQRAGLSIPHPTTPSDESLGSLTRQAVRQIGETLQEIATTIPDGPLDTVKAQRLQYTLQRLSDVAELYTVSMPETNIRPMRRAT